MCLLIVKKWSSSSLFLFTVSLYVTLCLLSLFFGKNLGIVCFKLIFWKTVTQGLLLMFQTEHTSRSSRFNQLDLRL